jgi:hypothetical protein
MKIFFLLTAILGGAVLSACGKDVIEIVECESYPLKQTRKLIGSFEFEHLKFQKAPVFDPLRRVGQFIMADSKFDFSASYVLDIEYQTGSQTITQHAEGCIVSSSLSFRVPLNAEHKKIMARYEEFLISNGVNPAETIKISQALNNASEYSQQANFNGYRLLYGLIDHPVRGKFFKIDIRK